jgi:CTD small phosphatase-like protein 2
MVTKSTSDCQLYVSLIYAHVNSFIYFSITEFADDGVDSSFQNFCFSDHEANWGLNECCRLMDIYSPDDDFSYLLDSPPDLLPSYTGFCDEFVSIDALMNMSSRCGIFPLIESATEASVDNKPCSSEVDLCFNNSEVLEWLNPNLLEGDLPDLVDFAELNSNATPAKKEQWTRNVTLVLDLDGMQLSIIEISIFDNLIACP